MGKETNNRGAALHRGAVSGREVRQICKRSPLVAESTFHNCGKAVNGGGAKERRARVVSLSKHG